MAGIVDYDPAELILTARAATQMGEIEAELEAKRQMLAFEPPDWRGLMGGDGEPTLGGVLACNLAGPRRVRAGAARDYFLGFSAINGWGEIWKAGGKVVKNVTGYDMCKLQAGAYGTLSVLTEVTLKVMPRPETACTILLQSMADEIAIARTVASARTRLTRCRRLRICRRRPRAARRVAAVAKGLGAVTALRLEGPAPSVAYRAKAIEALFGHGRRASTRPKPAALGAKSARCGLCCRLARVRLATLRRRRPRRPRVIERIARPIRLGRGFLRLGRRPHLAQPRGRRSGAGWRRGSGAGGDGQAGGHATLVVAPDAVRATVPVFEPLEGALAALSEPGQERLRPARRLQSRPDVRGSVTIMQTELHRWPSWPNSDIAESEKILRSCVHCGFCTATCPTYVLLGDELDSPRGRIYLIKDMLENDRAGDARRSSSTSTAASPACRA